MQLYPDLFDGVGTIKNAVVHLDVKSGATPKTVPDTLRDSLKADRQADRMESMKVIQKFRHLVTSDGLKPDPNKIDVIANMPAPQNKSQLQSFVGLCNYLTSYVPHLANVLALL